MIRLASPDKTPTCEHGQSANWWWDVMNGSAWAGPISKCGCCGSEFGYIDSASYSATESVTTLWTPRDRCAACGGKSVTERHSVG